MLGIHQVAKGSVVIDGTNISGVSTRDLLMCDVSYIPEDRLHDGFLPKSNVAQNLILGFHRQANYAKNGFIYWEKVYTTSNRLIDEYHIKTEGPREVGGNLSGGNIQRVLIARAFSCPSKLLVAHNPTRGLDIPSMDFVYSKLLESKKGGLATLLLSEDLDELLLLCDRIAVIYRGEILGMLNRNQFERYEIGRMMSGIRPKL
jgi:simple sugar transport system ATP-binding protein